VWEIKYLGIIIIGSTLIDYFIGLKIHSSSIQKTKKRFLYLSLASNLSVLFIFKYFNFFLDNTNEIIQLSNSNYQLPYLEVILPVGISFYTFQTLSYSLDIYNGKIKTPEKNIGIFALFVSFFPQLVAGPIERASNLLPQFHQKHDFSFDKAASGLTLALWGLFKKVVVADRLSIIVNEIYNNPTEYSGFTIIIGTVFFAFQIYCDFSGYSDIAIGIARTMGFDFLKNFRTPYFSKSIGEFWKRWHISLSTWFKDYLYIPLGGNRVVKWKWYYNLFITFLVSGFWHGAQWTFIIWGSLHGLYLILETLIQIKRNPLINYLLTVKTFILVCFGWIFFRANTLDDAFLIILKIFSINEYTLSQLSVYVIPVVKKTAYSMDFILSYFSIITLILLEFIFIHKISFLSLKFKYRAPIYISAIIVILILGAFEQNTFIYFQF
jgi:D-alanyl-lipoteichoic acid acyltransferase DltB (MBOAT superfamily)